MTYVEAFAVGALGGAMYEASRWIGLRQRTKLPAYFYKVHYWILTILLSLVGGVVAILFEPNHHVEALYLGIGAPALLSRIAALAPEKLELGEAEKKASLQDWGRG